MADGAYSDIRETSTTGGTGNQVLAGAFDASYRAVGTKYVNGQKGFFVLRQGAKREVTEITYNSGANSISRAATPIWSTNSNNLVNFDAGVTVDIFDTAVGPSDLSVAQLARLAFLFGTISFTGDETLTAAQVAQALKNVAQTTVTFTTDDTVTTAHRGALITLNAATAKTLSFTAGATLGNGFRCRIKNIGTNKWTLDPNSSETINAATTINLYPNEGCEVVWDGSAFHALGLASRVLLDTKSPSGAASADFSSLIDGYFPRYTVEIEYVIPATDNVELWCRVSVGGGFRSTAGDYRWAARIEVDGAAGSNAGSTSDTKIRMPSSLSNSTARPFSGKLFLTDNNQSARFKPIEWQGRDYDTVPQMAAWRGAGLLVAATAAIDGVQFLASSGNITGVFRLYGER